jgi:hypothetical protein
MYTLLLSTSKCPSLQRMQAALTDQHTHNHTLQTCFTNDIPMRLATTSIKCPILILRWGIPLCWVSRQLKNINTEGLYKDVCATSIPYTLDILFRYFSKHFKLTEVFACIKRTIVRLAFSLFLKVAYRVKQSHYRPWQALSFAGGPGSDFKTIGTWRWQGCQPYAPLRHLYPQEISWYSFLLEAELTPGP